MSSDGKHEHFIDTATIAGERLSFYSTSKHNTFYTDRKYFFFFYPNNKSMFGELKKSKDIIFYNNIFELLSYCNSNMTGYSVDSSMNDKTVAIELPKNNDLDIRQVLVTLKQRTDDFNIKNIAFESISKVNGSFQTSKTSIDILDYCFDDNNCVDKIDLSPKSFYEIIGNKIVLKGDYSGFDLTKFAQF